MVQQKLDVFLIFFTVVKNPQIDKGNQFGNSNHINMKIVNYNLKKKHNILISIFLFLLNRKK